MQKLIFSKLLIWDIFHNDMCKCSSFQKIDCEIQLHQAHCDDQKRNTLQIRYYMPIFMTKDVFCGHFVLCINSDWRKSRLFLIGVPRFKLSKLCQFSSHPGPPYLSVLIWDCCSTESHA